MSTRYKHHKFVRVKNEYEGSELRCEACVRTIAEDMPECEHSSASNNHDIPRGNGINRSLIIDEDPELPSYAKS